MNKIQYQPDENRYDGRMQYRQCGRSGLKLPVISLGHWHNFGGDSPTDNQRQMIYTAFDLGITHFDLANNYGPPPGSAEINVGKILRDLPRDEIIVSSKAGYGMWAGPYGDGGSRKYLMASLDQSLRRVGVEYFDIFYSHRFDTETPLEETIGSLHSAIEQGKALYAGISSYSSQQTRQVQEICERNHWHRILIHQPNYSMFSRWIEAKLTGACSDLGIGMIVFCPLYQGLLTSKYIGAVPDHARAKYAPEFLSSEDINESTLSVIRQLSEIAQARGQTLAQMAIAWILRLPEITSVLVGASHADQLKENCGAIEQLEFSQDELSQIENLLGQAVLPTTHRYEGME